MRKVLCLFVAACLLAAVPAKAAPPTTDWHMYWVGADRSEAYVAVVGGSYRVRGSRVLVSSFVEYAEGNYSMVGEVYDCATLRWTSVGQFDYDKNDKLLRQYTPPDSEQRFKTATVRDRQVIIMNTICSGGTPRSPSAVQASFLDLAKQLKAMRSQ